MQDFTADVFVILKVWNGASSVDTDLRRADRLWDHKGWIL